MDSIRNNIRTRVRTSFLAIWCCLPVVLAYFHYHDDNKVKRITYPIAVWSPSQLQAFEDNYKRQKHDDRLQLACIALTIYGENRGQGLDGLAVANVVMNRVYDSRYPSTPCEVVLQRNQIEPLGKGKRLRKYAELALHGTVVIPDAIDPIEWARLKRIASQAYYSIEPDPTKGATHFWSPTAQRALGRNAPRWSRKLTHVASVGNHRYYY